MKYLLMLLLVLGVATSCTRDADDNMRRAGDNIEEGVNDTGRALEDAVD